MARSAGTVRIVFEAGTASFVADVDKAKAKVREFGSETKSGFNMRYAILGAKDLMEGRYKYAMAEAVNETMRFQGALKGLSIGGIVLAGIAYVGYEVNKTLKEMAEAPGKVVGAFEDLNRPLNLTNDQIALTNAQLENQIAKLEGRRENTLKVALLEAQEAADKLAASLEKDLSALNKVMQEEALGGLKAFFTGQGETKGLEEELGGATGLGGFTGRIREMLSKGAKPAELQAAYQGEIEEIQKEFLGPALFKHGQFLSTTGIASGDVPAEMRAGFDAAMHGAGSAPDQRIMIEKARGAMQALREQMSFIDLEAERGALTGKKGQLEGARAAEALTRPYADRMKAIDAEMEGLRVKLMAVGQPAAVQGILKGFGEARKAIEEANKQLEHINPNLRLTEAQMGAISKYYVIDKPKLELETQWAEKLDSATTSLQEQLAAQRMLSAAIGQGFAAQRRASIESQVLGKAGLENYSDPSKAADIAKLRAEVTAEYDAKRAAASATSVDALQKEVQAQDLLTEAQRLGEEEVRRLGALAIWRAGIEKGLTGQEIVLQIQLYYAKLRTHDAAETAQLNAQTTATERLAQAQLQGAEAARKQGLENKYAEMERTRKGADVPAMRRKDEADWQLQITERVANRIDVYSDELAKLDQERDKLLEIMGVNGATLAQRRALRDIENERLGVLKQEQLAQGTVQSGVRAFFYEMEEGGRRLGNVIYESLTSAVDRVSGELAKLFTGQKTSFGQMVQGIGEDLLKGSIKTGLSAGLGALGKRFGLGSAVHRDGSTPQAALYVSVVGGGSAPASIAAAGAGVGGTEGGGAGGFLGAVLGMLIPHAEGGPVSPSDAYLVGENGPEILTQASGYITSNAELRRTFGGTGGSGGAIYQIDARGADLGAANRIQRGMEAVHQSAVATSVRANSERAKRVPQRQRN